MFVPISEKERQEFFRQNSNCYIPGYTGHCPTLKFQYGTTYGAKTKEILQNRKSFKHLQKTTSYRQNNEHDKILNQPIVRNKVEVRDPLLDYNRSSSKFILGYTGFVPTLNFRYGKSYGRSADDSMYEFGMKQRLLRQDRKDMELRSQSAPKYPAIRNTDNVKYALRERNKDMPQIRHFKDRDISPEFPPISGYTGFIPRVKGHEESVSKTYDKVVRRSLSLLRDERAKRNKSYKL